MTNPEIIAAIRARGYPADPYLTDAEITEGINGALRDLKYEYLFETVGQFSTVAQQAVYDLFNPVLNTATQQGVLAGGVWLRDAFWSPVAGVGDVDVFGITPWLQGMNIMPGAFDYSFRTPSDLVMFEQQWGAFTKRFSSLEFYAESLNPGSPVRFSPMPIDQRAVFCRYARRRTTNELQQDDESWFLEFVEYQCCRTVARKLRMVAGTQQADIRDLGLRSKQWDDDADRIEKNAWIHFRERNSNFGAAGQRS